MAEAGALDLKPGYVLLGIAQTRQEAEYFVRGFETGGFLPRVPFYSLVDDVTRFAESSLGLTVSPSARRGVSLLIATALIAGVVWLVATFLNEVQ